MFTVRSSVANRPILGQNLYDSLKTLGIIKPFRGGVKHREKLQRQGQKREHTIRSVVRERSSVCGGAVHNNKQDGRPHNINIGSRYAPKTVSANCESKIRTVISSDRLNHRKKSSNISRGVNVRNLVEIKAGKEEKQPEKQHQQRLNLLYLNARSVCNKTEMLSNKIKDDYVDVCCIAETWLHQGDKDNIIIGQLCPTG